jgi:alkaline phosphatase D
MTRRHSLSIACMLASAVIAYAQQETVAVEALKSPPVVGHVTDSTAMVWAATVEPSALALHYRAKGDAGSAPLTAAASSSSAGAYTPVIFTLTGLNAGTTYVYRVVGAGEGADALADAKLDPWAGPASDASSGEFTTAPVDGQSGRFTIAVSSCMHSGKEPEQLSWRLMRSQQPSLHLLLGDVVYADTTDHDTLWEHHLQQRAVTDFANVLRTTPNYAMWDDHDYGPNDSDGTSAGKENSLRAFRELWALPPTGTKDTPGAFYSFQWGDVEFFMLDGRYHRSPDKAENDDNKRMLGDAQFEWLMAGLRNSTATFKVLASGSTLQASGADGWRIYDFARNRLYNAINESSIDGVLYLSGDVHASYIQVHEAPGYPLVEVISSGIANSGTKSFATLAFDTETDDPTVRIRIIYGDGSVQEDKVFALSAMTVAR